MRYVLNALAIFYAVICYVIYLTFKNRLSEIEEIGLIIALILSYLLLAAFLTRLLRRRN